MFAWLATSKSTVLFSIFPLHLIIDLPLSAAWTEYDARNLNFRQTVMVTMTDHESMPLCPMQGGAGRNFAFEPNDPLAPPPAPGNVPRYFITKRRSRGRQGVTGPNAGRYGIQFVATRRPPIHYAEDGTNMITSLDFDDRPTPTGKRQNQFRTQIASIFCERSTISPIKVWPQQYRQAIHCEIAQKLVRYCLEDTDVNPGATIGLEEGYLNTVFDIDGNNQLQLIRDHCVKLVEVKMENAFTADLQHRLGISILRAARDARYLYVIGKHCSNNGQRWDGFQTTHVLDAQRFEQFYEETVTNSDVGNWFFCRYDAMLNYANPSFPNLHLPRPFILTWNRPPTRIPFA